MTDGKQGLKTQIDRCRISEAIFIISDYYKAKADLERELYYIIWKYMSDNASVKRSVESIGKW